MWSLIVSGSGTAPTGAWVTCERGGVLPRREEVELDGAAPFPWPPGSGRTVADMVAWVNAELMKNVAELGQLILIHYAASQPADLDPHADGSPPEGSLG